MMQAENISKKWNRAKLGIGLAMLAILLAGSGMQAQSWIDSSERNMLYAKLASGKQVGMEKCDQEKSEIRKYYRDTGALRDENFKQLKDQYDSSAKRDALQDRRIALLMDQNTKLLQSSQTRARAANELIENVKQATEKANVAVDKAVEVVAVVKAASDAAAAVPRRVYRRRAKEPQPASDVQP